MSKNVFANGREISGKKDDNKSICSMPDVCLSPPSPPAGPIPIPYPNTSKASDTSDGSKTVKIGGGEVGLKNASNYKKSNGDEAATKSLGMGGVSHSIQGKLKHAAWSMDVKIEGKNVIRQLDMVTQNHSNPTNVVPGIDIAGQAPPAGDEECVELENQVRDDCKKDTKTGKLENGKTMARANACGSNVKAATPMSNMIGRGRGAIRRGYLRPKPTVGREIVRDKKGYIAKGSKPGKEPTIACSNKQYQAKGSGGGASTHCEAKIIEKAHSQGCKNITMRINWNDKGELRNGPCPMCKRSICIAARECDMKIEICVEENGKLQKKDACPDT